MQLHEDGALSAVRICRPTHTLRPEMFHSAIDLQRIETTIDQSLIQIPDSMRIIAFCCPILNVWPDFANRYFKRRHFIEEQPRFPYKARNQQTSFGYEKSRLRSFHFSIKKNLQNATETLKRFLVDI